MKAELGLAQKESGQQVLTGGQQLLEGSKGAIPGEEGGEADRVPVGVTSCAQSRRKQSCSQAGPQRDLPEPIPWSSFKPTNETSLSPSSGEGCGSVLQPVVPPDNTISQTLYPRSHHLHKDRGGTWPGPPGLALSPAHGQHLGLPQLGLQA